jgi:hypothetical protein
MHGFAGAYWQCVVGSENLCTHVVRLLELGITRSFAQNALRCHGL